MLKNEVSLSRRFWTIAIPFIVQNGISTFVSLLDNIMVGSVGTLQMSGVSIVNQLILVFNLCITGGTASASIFTAQFYGSADHKNIRHAFRFKLLFCLALGILGICAFWFWSDPLIGLYLQGDGDQGEAMQALGFGRDYLNIMLLGLIPFALTNAYASTLRECWQFKVPMLSGIAAVLINLVLNYILIFGHLGLPAMGASGAAWATVISRFVEFAIVAIWTHCNSKTLPFIKGLFRSVYIPGALLKRICLKGIPLLINEALFSFSEAFLNQIYSTRGLDVVPANNIANTIYGLLNVIMVAMAHAAGVYMGQMMGANRPKAEIRSTFNKLMCKCLIAGLISCGVMFALSGLFPRIYNTTPVVQQLSTAMICIYGLYLLPISYISPVYFTLQAGGNSWSTFFIDCGFSWLCIIPTALLLTQFTDISIIPIYAICRGTGLIKAVLCYFLIRKDSWIRNLAKESCR